MHGQRRTPMGWAVVVAIVGGVSLIGWAVEEALSFIHTTALVFGIVLVAYGFAASGRADGAAKRTEEGVAST